MIRPLVVTALPLMMLLALATGCLFQDDAATPTPSATPTATPGPAPTVTPTVTPGPATICKVFNGEGRLSGLDFVLTVACWTGDEAEVEWSIRNGSGGAFCKNRLYSIFYPGAVATDQDGAEGEYFVPTPIGNDLAKGATLHYQTKWLFPPESRVITVRLADIFQEGSQYVDLSKEFVFWR
jgi:hypothetical protein